MREPLAPITRDQIIDHLVSVLEPNAAVVALWLEGADGRDAVDSHSDIDAVVTVEDGTEHQVFAIVESALASLAPVDNTDEESGGADGLQHRVYHLAGTPPGLLIDLVTQPRSRDFAFVPDHPDEVPRLLFDKADILQYRIPDPQVLSQRCTEARQRAERRFLPEARVHRYVDRGLYLEGMAAYQKYVLGPLIELLRLEHAPLTSGYGMVHVSAHLPREIVTKLEGLYRVTSTDELGRKLLEAREWFDELTRKGVPPHFAGPPDQC